MYKAIIFDFFGVLYDGQSVNEDLVKLITELKDQYKVGLVSNATGKYLRPILESRGLLNLFDEIVISADVGVTKPDPAIFNHILEKLDIEASEAVFTDDIPNNVTAAESLGIRSFVFTSEESLRKELAAAGVKVP